MWKGKHYSGQALVFADCRDQFLFSACQWFYGCWIMIFEAGYTVIISAKLQAWNWILPTSMVDPEVGRGKRNVNIWEHLKAREDATRSPKQRSQQPHKKGFFLPKINKSISKPGPKNRMSPLLKLFKHRVSLNIKSKAMRRKYTQSVSKLALIISDWSLFVLPCLCVCLSVGLEFYL